MTERYEDDALLAHLAEALRETRPLTEGVAARGKNAFTWRTIDEDLLTAELTFDSTQVLEATRRSGMAGGGRVLVFATEPRSVEIEVLSDRVVGQFIPPTKGKVEVESEHGPVVAVDVDELGFFLIEPVPVGIVRLLCTTPTTRLVTAWVHL